MVSCWEPVLLSLDYEYPHERYYVKVKRRWVKGEYLSGCNWNQKVKRKGSGYYAKDIRWPKRQNAGGQNRERVKE